MNTRQIDVQYEGGRYGPPRIEDFPREWGTAPDEEAARARWLAEHIRAAGGSVRSHVVDGERRIDTSARVETRDATTPPSKPGHIYAISEDGKMGLSDDGWRPIETLRTSKPVVKPAPAPHVVSPAPQTAQDGLRYLPGHQAMLELDRLREAPGDFEPLDGAEAMRHLMAQMRMPELTIEEKARIRREVREDAEQERQIAEDRAEQEQYVRMMDALRDRDEIIRQARADLGLTGSGMPQTGPGAIGSGSPRVQAALDVVPDVQEGLDTIQSHLTAHLGQAPQSVPPGGRPRTTTSGDGS